jgi:hypothetical protein
LWYTPPSRGSCIVRIQRRLNSASSSTSGSAPPASGIPGASVAAYAGKCSAIDSSVDVVMPELTTYLL